MRANILRERRPPPRPCAVAHADSRGGPVHWIQVALAQRRRRRLGEAAAHAGGGVGHLREQATGEMVVGADGGERVEGPLKLRVARRRDQRIALSISPACSARPASDSS
jgi:hypothetical protein